MPLLLAEDSFLKIYSTSRLKIQQLDLHIFGVMQDENFYSFI